METLKNYVNWKLAHSDKTATAEGYPLVMENCKVNKRMKQLEVYGDCMQRLGSKNLLPYPYYRTTATIDGVTFTDNGDGSITINGTATSNAVYYLYTNNTTLIPGTKRGDIITGSIFSDKEWDASVEKLYVILNYINSSGTMKSGSMLSSSNKTKTFTINDDWYGMGFYILVSKGGVVDNITLRVQIELGATATEYEPYIVSPSPDYPSEIQSLGDLITDTESEHYGKYKIPIIIRGKNLLDISFLSNISGITYQDGWYQGSAYSFLDYTTKNKNISGFFKPNTQYTFSWTVNTKATGLCFVVYYTDGTYSRLANASSTNTDLYLTGTSNIDKSIDYVTIDYGSNGTCKIKNIQIEKGSSATDYEPYVELVTQNIYLDEPLRKVGDYADYIDFKNKKVVRNIFSNSLNINSVYWKSTNVVRFDGFSGTTFRGVPDSIILSYIFLSNKRDWNNSRESIFQHSTTYYNWYWSIYWSRLGLTYDGTNVYRTDDTEQTPLTNSEIISIANEWIATLSNRDKTVYRVRETPIEEDISCQLPKTLAKTTVIEVDTTLLPSNIKGKYIIK